MGLSRNKVAVPEGAAGTPPFWRILKRGSRCSSAQAKQIKEHLLSGEDDYQTRRFVKYPRASLLHAVYLDIEKDEAERSNGEA